VIDTGDQQLYSWLSAGVFVRGSVLWNGAPVGKQPLMSARLPEWLACQRRPVVTQWWTKRTIVFWSDE
jgi:hypothetical protein